MNMLNRNPEQPCNAECSESHSRDSILRGLLLVLKFWRLGLLNVVEIMHAQSFDMTTFQ
jgi:hypothetical protein